MSDLELGDTIDSAAAVANPLAAVFSRDLSFRLESGRCFGPIKIAYKTFGTLNREKSNAVLVFPTLTATPQVAAETVDGKQYPGWWQEIVGRGKAIDTDKFFVICADHFGGCYGSSGPSSINPDTEKEFGLSFPGFFIQDMANVAIEFLQNIGIRKLHAVVGASIGGLLALEMIALQKGIAENALVLGASHRVSAQYLALNYIARQAIMLDTAWNDGDYYGNVFPSEGLSIARQIGHISYLNQLLLEEKFGRQPVGGRLRNHVSLGMQYQVESYLEHQGKKFCKRFDPNSYIYLSKAIDTFDLEKEFGSIAGAFTGAETKFNFISISSDNLFLPRDTKELHAQLQACGASSTFNEIMSPKGHDGLFLETEKIEAIIRKALWK